MNNKTLLTKEGYHQLLDQLAELKTKQDHLITQIENVAQPDESGEDGLATQLKEELELVNEQIDNLEEALESSEIITNGLSTNKNGLIQLGCKVKVKASEKMEKEFHIVSQLESDPLQNKISDQSPLGKALIGKKIHDEIEVEAPAGKIIYRIVAVA
jgi:transcription elongation factor GreA